MLKCPVCGEKMVYCHGDFKIPYFRHEKNCDCPDIYSEGITEEHLKGVKIIYEWLKTQENILFLQLEKWIPETRQRPDIYFERNEEGVIKKYVIEYQCSPISTKYNERHDLYRLNNITDIWILGTEKYDIGRFKSLIGIDAIDIKITSIKTKTIEREILESNNKLIYLNENMLYKIKEIEKIGCKTKFNIIYDIHNNMNNSFKQLFYEKGLNINNPKFNDILNYLMDTNNNLNNNANNLDNFCKYKCETILNEDTIIFRMSRYSDFVVGTIILNFNYNKISKEIIDNVYRMENEKIISLKNKIDFFNNKLEEEVKNFNDKIFKNGILKITEYNGIKQVEADIKNIQRIFKIYPINFKVTCNEWFSYTRYEGRSRRGNSKYGTGWALKNIKQYNIDEELYAKEIITIINDYFRDILFKEQSIILDELLLTDEEILKIENTKTIKNLIENKLKAILKKFDTINKYFSCKLKTEDINKIFISINGINSILNLDFELDVFENYIKFNSNQTNINKTICIEEIINKTNYINRVSSIIDSAISDALRNIKYRSNIK